MSTLVDLIQGLVLGVAWIGFWLLVAAYLRWSLRRHVDRQMERRSGFWYDRRGR